MLTLALLMLAATAVLAVVRRMAAAARRPLPWCMEHDQGSTWADHIYGECACARRPTKEQ